MKVPEKLIPLLLGLVVVAAFLLGRMQAQVEFLKNSGQTPSLVQNTGQQADTGSAPAVEEKVDAEGTQAGQPLTDEQWQKVLTDPAAERGQANAPVTIVEFSDYQCPFCSRYISDAYTQIDEQYIQTGKVRYLFRDFPLPFHANAVVSAMAARCAGDQGKYWEMHDVLFEKQDDWASGDPSETFAGYARDLALDVATFSASLAGENYKAEIDADYALAQEVGVGGTPGFFINGKLLVGAQPFSAFQKEIEANL
jgi:protein-disulfide isomerase